MSHTNLDPTSPLPSNTPFPHSPPLLPAPCVVVHPPSINKFCLQPVVFFVRIIMQIGKMWDGFFSREGIDILIRPLIALRAMHRIFLHG